ncbi:hypothetical protein C3941_09475 [Kaistia algarum]|uniref:hypothetical protein n=1 Tax=Kaistia algarum TaxID=2083279 RepID=UPI000CE82E2D|nr:hypothetical protein [Kaistia algarum]MCX5512288.1 hypothetical protein [Kaistia algarum]PPE80379.1 hypothetical protein C3941_09475 [Kaistia algarum]
MPAKDRILSMVDAPAVPLGHQTVTVTNAAQTLAQLLTAAAGAIAAIPANTKLIYLQPRGDGIRYAHGATTPTTAADATGIGTALYEGAQYPLRLDDFATLKLIAPSNVVLSIEFRG